MDRLIYLDNAATTKTAPEVVEAMLPYFSESYGNPSSVYSFASKNKDAVTEQREVIARALGAKSNEIYFTAGGTESDNWALKATAEAYASRGKHIITTKIEHHAILHTGEYLEGRGFEVTYLDVDDKGLVRPEDVEAAIRPDTILISVMFANNEIGTIEPIKAIGEIARRHNVLFHTDAVQAFGQVPINVDELGVDMLSASGHKLNGPKGIGFLYIRKGVKIRSFIHGGARECARHHRPWQGGGESRGHHGRAVRKGDRASRSPHQPGAGGDPLLPAQRGSGGQAAEQCQLQLPVYRGRVTPHHAGHEGDLCIQRLGLYLGLPGPVPRAAGHRPAP